MLSKSTNYLCSSMVEECAQHHATPSKTKRLQRTVIHEKKLCKNTMGTALQRISGLKASGGARKDTAQRTSARWEYSKVSEFASLERKQTIDHHKKASRPRTTSTRIMTCKMTKPCIHNSVAHKYLRKIFSALLFFPSHHPKLLFYNRAIYF